MTQNNCDKLDGFEENGQIKVTFSLKGREFTKEGRTSYFTNLDAWRLEKVGAETPQSAPAGNTFPDSADEPASVDTQTPMIFLSNLKK